MLASELNPLRIHPPLALVFLRVPKRVLRANARVFVFFVSQGESLKGTLGAGAVVMRSK
jgi:hypothetical protein